MSVNLELYKNFYYTARLGSVSAAARELYITQPAVSQSIRLLERSLGGQLFFRTPRGLKLTAEGEVLFKYIEQGYNFIRSAEIKFAEMQELISGELKIGASDMALKYHILPCLEDFHKVYGNIKIKVISGSTPRTIESLKKGLIDFGVISLPVENDSSIRVTEYAQIQDCFVAGEKYRELALKPVTYNELSRYPVLMLEKDTSTRKYIDSYLKMKGAEIIPEIELTTSDLLVQFAKRGLGISCVVKSFAEDELGSGTLYEIIMEESIPERKLGIVTLNDVPLSASAKKFLSIMKKEL